MFFHNKSDRPELFWMAAKRDGKCSTCAGDIIQGERIVYDPHNIKSYCSVCGADELGEDPSMDKPEPCQDCFC
jgi:hypothetical protein